MSAVLVDSSVLLDVLTVDSDWYDWSAGRLADCGAAGSLVINPIIYSEVSIRFTLIEELEAALPATIYRRDPLPWSAGFLAGKAFVRYRREGGSRPSPLPDFFIGAHAAVSGLSLLTRDVRRVRNYFPTVDVIAP